MPRAGIKYVLLYSTPEKWRFTVGEDPDAMACGGFDDLPGDVPFERAEARFRAMIADAYGREIDPNWQEQKPGWWGADLNIPPD